MAENIAAIGIKIDTSSVDGAVKSLETLASKGASVDKSLGQVEGVASKTGKSLDNLGRAAQSAGKIGDVGRNAQEAARGMAAVGESADRASRGVKGMARSFVEMKDKADESKRSVSMFGDALGGMAAKIGAAAGAFASLSKVMGAASQWTDMSNRLKLITDSAEGLARAQADVVRIAMSSRSPLEATAQLYQRIAQQQEALGMSTSRVASAVETVSKAMTLSGVSAESANAALVQFGQALASGVLRGDELNSILEQAHGLAQAMADGLGTTTGKLREMGAQGQLTAEMVVGALEKQSDAISAQFDKMVPTMSQALTNLNTSFIVFVGKMDEFLGVSSAIASTVQWVAKNFDILAVALGSAAIVGAVAAFGGIGAAIAGVASAAATAGAVLVGALFTPIGLAVATVGGLTAAYIAFKDELDGTGDIAVSLGDIFGQLGKDMVGAFDGAGDSASKAADANKSAAANTMGFWEKAIRGVAAAADALATVIVGTVAGVDRAMSNVASAMTEVFAKAFNWIAEKAEAFINTVSRGVNSVSSLFGIGQIGPVSFGRVTANGAKFDITNSFRDGFDAGATARYSEMVDGMFDRIRFSRTERAGRAAQQEKEIEEKNRAAKATRELAEAEDRLEKQRIKALGVDKEYQQTLRDLQTLRDAGRISEQDYISRVEELAKATWKSSAAGKADTESRKARSKAGQDAARAAENEARAYQSFVSNIEAKIAAQEQELATGTKLTLAEQARLQLAKEVEKGRISAAKAAATETEALLKRLSVVEKERELANALQSQREAEYRRVSALADGAAALRASNDALAEEIKTMGLSRRELVAYTRAKLQAEIATKRAALASAQSAHMYTREQAALEEHIGQLERQIELLERRAQQEGMREAHAEHLDMWASIDRTAHDVFVNIWEDGAGTFKRLGQTLKAAVLDWLYQLTVRRWVVHLAASFSGAPASAVAGALGGGPGGGVLGNLGSVGNLGGLFGGGAYGSLWGLGNLGSGFGAGWAALGGEAGFGGAMSAGWSSITAGNIGGGLGTWAGAVAPWALGIGGGAAIGRAISNGYAISGSGNGVSNAGAVVGAIIGSIIPGIGTAIGALLGGLLGGATGGLLNRAFGRRLSDTGFEGTLGGAEGFTGRSWQHYRGGWFRSDKTRYGEISAEFQRSIAQTYIGLRDQLGAYASVLKLPVDKISDFTHQIRLSLHGLKPEEAAQRIQEALAGAQEELARQILRGWTGAAASDEFQLAYQREGETNVQTLERLALSLTTVNAAFEAMGRTLLDASVWGGDLASQITDLFGQGQAGRDAFAAAASGYMNNYYTEAERRAALQRQVQRQFDALGLTMPDINAEDARAQFRHLVDSLDLTTESGRRAYAALMALQGAFAELTPAMTDAAEAARAAAEAQLSAARTATDAAMRGLESAIRREIGTWQTTLRGAQEDAAQARAVMQAAGGAARQLYGQSDPTRAMLARQGQDYITRALSGARAGLLPDAGELGRAIEAARGGLNVNDYASYAEYERAQLVLAGRLAEMEELGGQQLTAAERQEELAKTQINQLEKTLDYWRRQLELARGQADSLLSIDQATSAIVKALAEERAAKEAAAKEAAKGADAAKGGGASGGGGDRASTWRPSTAGKWDEENQRLYLSNGGYIDYRTGKRHYADGSVSVGVVPQIELDRFKREALRAAGVPGYARGTNYVTHDHVAIVHEGERILPAADNRALMRALDAGGPRSSGDAELRALRAEVASLRALLARVADASERSAMVLRNASDGDALQIREATA